MDSREYTEDGQVAVEQSIDKDEFCRRPSVYQMRRLKTRFENNDWTGPPFEATFLGIAAKFPPFTDTTVAFAVRDSTYLLDFTQKKFHTRDWHQFPDSILEKAREYQQEHGEKFIGVALSTELVDRCPELCSRLWAELDIVPIVLSKSEEKVNWGLFDENWTYASLDDQAESMARKCIGFFGPSQAPIPQVGLQGHVEVDAKFHVRLTSLSDYENTVGRRTWSAIQKFANDLKKRRVKVAFFSATPQGGGVALMRHALIRFLNALGTNFKWYVPKPRPGVFRITKNNHNILQGVAPPGTRFTAEDRDILRDWVQENAERYWFRKRRPPIPEWFAQHGPPAGTWFGEDGPLVPPSEGGADVIVIDDPQLPFLIPLIKERTPNRPVIFRSHIQIRSDLVATPGTPQAEAWGFLWEAIKQADLFISHPVRGFVPENVPLEMVGYQPASTDWLDGLNKPMSDWNISYYGRIFNSKCREQYMPNIAVPNEDYIIQISRFDPSKGICDVLESYNAFHKLLSESRPELNPPKLIICGHGSVDDPDGSMVYDIALEYVEQRLAHIKSLICIMRIGPTDQMLNALLSKAKIALQLSTREGFEIKVSEALHKGKPVIATLAGGIPLQVQHGQNGFLVDIGDTHAVARHLFDLWTDVELYDRMSAYASMSVSDEVSTVGNALSWLYLGAKMSEGKSIRPNERWINDMAREEANEPYDPQENRLKRAVC